MRPSKLLQALLAVVFLAFTATAHAADPVTIRAGSVAPEGTPWAMWLESVKKRMEKETNGGIKLKMFLSGKLGGEKEMVEDTKKGNLQLFGGSVGALAAQYVPELNVFELPFLFESDAEADYVMDKVRPQVSKLLDERGFVFVMWAENGWHGYGSKGKCVMSPEDMKGLKMRSQESSIHIDTFRAFGASPVEIPVPEVLSALQTGTVDGFSNTPLFSWASAWKDGVTHFSYTRHIYQPAAIVLSKKWFENVPADIKPSLLSTKEERAGLVMVRDLTKPLLDNMEAEGKKVCRPSDEQRKAFQGKVKPVWDAFAKKSKGNKEIYDAVMTAKKEYAAQKK